MPKSNINIHHIPAGSVMDELIVHKSTHFANADHPASLRSETVRLQQQQAATKLKQAGGGVSPSQGGQKGPKQCG